MATQEINYSWNDGSKFHIPKKPKAFIVGNIGPALVVKRAHPHWRGAWEYLAITVNEDRLEIVDMFEYSKIQYCEPVPLMRITLNDLLGALQ